MTIHQLIWKISLLCAGVGALWILAKTTISIYKLRLDNEAKIAEKFEHLKKK